MRETARKALEALLVVLALVAAFGLAGRQDYEDRCRALSPASIEEAEASDAAAD